MPRPRFAITVAAIALTAGAYTEHRLRDLEARYPPLPPSSTTIVAATPPREHTVHDHAVFGARIPRSLLPRTHRSPTHTWTHSFCSTRPLAAEARAFSNATPDRGEYGFFPGQRLLNGVFVVERVEADLVVVGWSMTEAPVRLFEVVARWGYPWRLMSGGRNHWEVVGDGDEIEVRFGSVHFYRDCGDGGKAIPRWVGRLHKAYARYLVDVAVVELQAAASSHESMSERI